jgi:para-nitrobenzyl esterase
MAHPLLSEESRVGASGNYGQLDLIAALKWVQKNIAAFGGDPDRVTLWGQSGGSMKITGVMASPLAKGLFHRVIAMSGIVGGKSLEDAEQMGLKIAEKLGIPDGPGALEALRAKSWQEIVTASLDKDLGYRPDVTVDGWYLLDTVPNTFAAGKQHNVPLMIGMTEADITPIIRQYALIPNIKTGTSPMYLYLWKHVPTGWRMDGVKAYHSLDKGYVFGTPWTQTLGNYERYAKPAGATQKDPGWDEHDDWLTEFALETWAQFAATGDPNLPSNPHPRLGRLETWPPYEPDTEKYLEIKSPTEAKSGFSKLDVFE